MVKGIIYDIKRFAVHDGPGIRTTIFFKGCPLKCSWCHNPESIDIKPLLSTKKIVVDGCIIEEVEETGRYYTTEEVLRLIEREVVFMEETGGGVTFSGGEPTMQVDFLEYLLLECNKRGIHTAVDTSGQTSWDVLKRIIPLTDLFLYDVKHTDTHKHELFTGVSNSLIVKNLERLVSHDAPLRVRVPVVPGFNNTMEEQKSISLFINQFKEKIEQVDLLPYHAIASHKYKRFNIGNSMLDIPSLSEEQLYRYLEKYHELGIHTTIGG